MKMYAPIRIILADDHELFRDGFSAMMNKETDIELVGEAKDGNELIAITRLLKPDVVVTDILMPGMNGITATKNLLKEFPHMGVVVLSMSNEENLIVEMMKAGAHGYILKNVHKDEIINAIKTVYKGDKYYCRDTANKMAKLLAYKNYPPLSQTKPVFSEKEIAIIRLICKEHSSQEIADQLKHSIRTIDSYRKNILKKMKVKNVNGIIMYAIKNKIYNPDETIIIPDSF